MLNHLCDEEGLMTHHLPTAFKYVKEKNPSWLTEAREDLKAIGCTKEAGFDLCLRTLKSNIKTYDIPQLKDEFDTSDFGDYMVKNSLLNKIGSNK